VRRGATGVLAALLAAAVAAGCGQSGSASKATALQRGSVIFAHSCSGCHTIAGRETGAEGGDLVNAHLSVADLKSFIVVMPVRRPLSRTDVADVAEFVHAVAGG
jgi:mono/diheme cytochrome c family protein